MRVRLAVLLLLVAGLVLARPCAAHEVRPAYLEIDQTAPTSFKVIWKQPTMGDVAIHLEPHLSNGWLEQPPADEYAAGGFLIKTWRIQSASPSPLAGAKVSVEGLEDTITDVFVRVRLRGGRGYDTILRPESPSTTVAAGSAESANALAFLALGVTHILTGPDHLLFVLGLLLIVRDRRSLLKTVTAFTLAHSITLALATLGHLQLSTAVLNALVALSILFIAPEALRAQRGEVSLTTRYPWAVAFAFGLLHGLGFASGLATLDLDRMSLAIALVLFNVGVEIGQLAFIGLVLALRRAFRLMELDWPRPVALSPTYAIGVLGALWTLQYSAVALAGG